MAASFSHYSCQAILVATFIFFSTFASAVTHKPNSRPFKKIYAFGDSITDTGNTRTAAGAVFFDHVSNPPYGSTFFHRPTNRYSDGRLVIDFAAERLSLPYLPPYRHLRGISPHGVNFAVGGATAINHAFFVQNNSTLDMTPESMQTQLIWFNKYLERQGCRGSASSSPECAAAFEDALFWVGEMGINDYGYITGTPITSDTIQTLAISSLTAFLQAVLKKGAKYVVVQGMPPSGCFPLSLVVASEDDIDNLGCVKSVNRLSYAHNAKYKAKLRKLRRQFPDAVITYVDYWNAYHTVVKNPGNYGFKEALKACCGSGDPPYNFNIFAGCGTPSARACPNPSEYVNWDGAHATEALYKVVADMFFNGTFSHPPLAAMLEKKIRQLI